MEHIVILKPWPSRTYIAGMPDPALVIDQIEVPHEEIVFTQLLEWLSWGEGELGWKANKAQTFSRIGTAAFDAATNFDLWVDEDSIVKDLPANFTADRFHYPYPLWGRVVVTAPTTRDGVTYPLNPSMLEALKAFIGF